MDTQCPNCGSGATKSRIAAHELGTRESQVKRSYSGTSFGRRAGFFFGSSRSRGSSQSLFAKRAGPTESSLLAVLLIGVIIALALKHYSVAFALFAILVLALFATRGSGDSYLTEWICMKCGSIFSPRSADANASHQPSESTAPFRSSDFRTQPSGSTKQCSICGRYRPATDFAYGNRENRSYCSSCSSEEKAAYRAGGADGARRFRDGRRATWRKT